MKLLTTIFGFLIILSACSVEEILSPEQQLEKDINIIKDYLAAENTLDKANETESGLHYYLTETGNDTIFPDPTSVVDLFYKGYFTNNMVFDSTPGYGSNNVDTTHQKVSRFIPGFSEGLTFFNEGAKGKILIPSYLGYGTNGTSNIPGNTVIIFDVEMHRIIN